MDRALCLYHENRVRPMGDGHCLHPVLLHLHRTNPVEAVCEGCPGYKTSEAQRSKEFIVQSGAGYILNRETREFTTDPVLACRMCYFVAIEVVDMLKRDGFGAGIIEVVVGRHPSNESDTEGGN